MSTSTLPRFDDASARRRIRESLDESLIVEAAAGTGKTTELVRRILNVLRAGRTTIDRVAAVTFTHKAAGELKLRLRQGLDRTRAAASGDERRHLEDALERLEEASIGTIHAFCAQILRERPVEARVDPAFTELSEVESSHLFERAFRSWFQQALNENPPGLRRALARLAWTEVRDERSPVEQLQFAARVLIEWRDYPAKWASPDFDLHAAIDARVESLLEAAPRVIPDFATWVGRAEASRVRDYPTLEALLLKLLGDLKKQKRKGAELYIQPLEEFKTRADAHLAALLREEMDSFVNRYDELKRHAGKLDFLDLLLVARNLIRDNAEVRAYLQHRFTHLFVDEFQDTDPLQAEILLLLAADLPAHSDWLEITPTPGKLFVVGDPKQSIYKFRRADVVLYEQICRRLVARGVGLIHLTKSFRSVRPIQECVNAAFEPEMTGDTTSGQAEYVPLEEFAPAPGGQPSVVVLPPPAPYGKQRLARHAIDRCLPDAICAYVEWLLRDSGWTVRSPEHPAERTAISERHICLLFRRMINFGEDITRPYTRSLEARGIQHLLVGSKSFHTREEVETFRAAMSAVEWPDDELSVFATLRGGLFAISDAALLRWRHEIGPMHPFRPLPGRVDKDLEAVAEALLLLARLHRARNRLPVAETVNLLLEATRAHAGFALRPAGHQILANVNRIADLARSFELSGGISFRGFVEELESQAQRVEIAEAPVLEEGSEGVRLMTVHSAKGLEFPVVILADMTANIASQEPDRHVDGERRLCAMRLLRCAPLDLTEHIQEERVREQSEGVRIAYVAATRARDLLVIPAVGDERLDGWLSPLNKAIYPSQDRWRRPGVAPGCPKFGEATVLDRPPNYGREEISVRPGLHTPPRGSHSVVWWDPSKLRLGVEASHGLRQQEILAEKPAARVQQGVDRYQQWRLTRQDTLQRGERMQFDIFTPSEAPEGPLGFTCDVSVEIAARSEGRPFGPRFGTLVHAALRDSSLDADRAGVTALVQVHSRLLGAPEEERDAAIEVVASALEHPVVRRARVAPCVHREYPIVLPQDGKILEGVIDLAFLEDDVWRVVDFKTDADVPARQSHYRVQLLWYAFALSRITGRAATGILLAL
jgi:ATP-dependent exoDNAse (exonuclease V) beta subunit